MTNANQLQIPIPGFTLAASGDRSDVQKKGLQRGKVRHVRLGTCEPALHETAVVACKTVRLKSFGGGNRSAEDLSPSGPVCSRDTPLNQYQS